MPATKPLMAGRLLIVRLPEPVGEEAVDEFGFSTLKMSDLYVWHGSKEDIFRQAGRLEH
ncbi:hypothetical protein POL68_37125 [Stigmatella sp. ncwal1]|uniref:Uncharacterized protein n=1 Tax=Stigmatella ashevillensis TaxID=2995309 RepID=A0ABT5DLZ3_9BACT|nr:hypothetical protein [Stigmatella ashevillena]MDC0714148.1 hypothetical protein [Stigmatella ashevillena]